MAAEVYCDQMYFLMLFAAGGGNLFGVSHLPWLLCQQQLHFSATWRADRRRCLGQVIKILIGAKERPGKFYF